jgi:hypothetical protein
MSRVSSPQSLKDADESRQQPQGLKDAKESQGRNWKLAVAPSAPRSA